MTEDHPQEPSDIGSVGEEAAKLLAALSGWARDHGGDHAGAAPGAASSLADVARDVNDHIATGGEECRYCPVCRGIHAVRELSPEVREHLRAAAGSALQAVVALIQSPGGGGAETRGAGIQRVDVD